VTPNTESPTRQAQKFSLARSIRERFGGTSRFCRPVPIRAVGPSRRLEALSCAGWRMLGEAIRVVPFGRNGPLLPGCCTRRGPPKHDSNPLDRASKKGRQWSIADGGEYPSASRRRNRHAQRTDLTVADLEVSLEPFVGWKGAGSPGCRWRSLRRVPFAPWSTHT